MFCLAIFVCTVIAFSLSAVSGGGAGLLLMPVLRTGMSLASVPVALTVGSTMSSAARIGTLVRHVDWSIVRWFVPWSLPGVGMGVWLLQHVSPLYVELFMGVFLLANVVALRRKVSEPPELRQLRPCHFGVLGMVAGVVSGLTGAVGLLFNGFYLRHGLAREAVVATRAANEITVHAVKLALYAASGLVNREAMGIGAIMGVGAIVSALAVKHILPRVSEAAFHNLNRVAMTVAGLIMASASVSELVRIHVVSPVAPESAATMRDGALQERASAEAVVRTGRRTGFA
ncbi:sulfite exporter TauE/SafE family protein [Luteibacter sp.]|uniref:sulfite exporter TauE/SafE family protein n=1 Tax=Luteibacter sp. TaxID=1886636 RepID=UPI003F7EDC52